MPRTNKTLLTDLSTVDLKRLLAARERIDVLESEKARLVRELTKVEKELDALIAGAVPAGKPGRGRPAGKKRGRPAGKKTVKKAAGKKASGKKTARKKTAAKKAPKKAPKKAATKKAATKKVVKKSAGKVSARKPAGGRVKLEDVVVAVIRKHGGPMSYQDLAGAIIKGKLFKSKSKNFDNVLRRTLSTSKAVKRVGRGVYDAA